MRKNAYNFQFDLSVLCGTRLLLQCILIDVHITSVYFLSIPLLTLNDGIVIVYNLICFFKILGNKHSLIVVGSVL